MTDSSKGQPLPTRLRPKVAAVRSRARVARDRAKGEVQFARWARTPEGRANAERLAALKGRYAGQRAVIMGNGPSLLKSDLNRLKGVPTLVSNSNFLIWDQLDFVPTITAVEDRLVAEDRAEQLRELTGTTRLFAFDLLDVLGPPSDSAIFVNFPRSYTPLPKFGYDLDRRAFWGGTVTFMNLQIAWYLGCSEIVLIGVDHNYVVPDGPAGAELASSSDNHMHPDYFAPGHRWQDPNVARMERAYECAKVALDARGVRVLNATVGGNLNTFPRADFDELFPPVGTPADVADR